MEKIYLPKIKIREPEKLWLEKLYNKIKKNEKISYKIIRAELFKELPTNFYPNTIDSRLVNSNGEYITFLGIQTIDPHNDLISLANKVFIKIKEILLIEPEKARLDCVEISQLTSIPESKIGLIFKLFSPYGRFWESAGHSEDYYGHSYITFDQNNLEIFHQYLYFKSIEELISKYHKEEDGQKKRELNLEFSQNKSLPVELTHELNPIFTSRISQIDPKLCFVLMPFKESWSDRVYAKYIRDNIEALGLQCLRADNLTGRIFIEDIWTKINQSAFIIADVTTTNPNVMYELGIAHTIGKPVILITQDITQIPFDFTHLRHYTYTDNADGKDMFSERLRAVIPEIYKEFYPKLKIKL